MKITFSLVALFFLIASPIHSQDNEIKSIKTVFEDYKSAILNDRGEEAANYVDSRTIQYYIDMLEIIKVGDSSSIEKLNILDKVTVFSVRHRADKSDIMPLDGKGLFIYAIKQGMVGKNSVVNSSVGEIIIKDNFAQGQFVVGGDSAPFYFHFYKEDGKWKIDLTQLFSVGMGALKKMAEDSGQQENDFIFTLLEMLTGKQPGLEIWVPFANR